MATTSTARPPATAKAAPPDRLPFTGDDEADRLIAGDGTALLIGFVLDQQVTVQKAFAGPLEIRRRLGSIDAGALAATDPATLRSAFAERPAVHRFPGTMAERVQALSKHLVAGYSGDGAAVWRDVADGDELWRRLSALPGIGPMKARTLMRLLSHQYGVRPIGYEKLLPQHPTLGDVTTADELAAYQAAKRAHKAQLRAAGMSIDIRSRAPRGQKAAGRKR
ncbi:MAG TPA: HhH-GPD-type base excision DNA repair protein [Candidatus Dormibacteraeota bacterium]|nr:HhH-GPD-type base excision DNA repair protein [Candidatus Dormibacteraeota bacterium]